MGPAASVTIVIDRAGARSASCYHLTAVARVLFPFIALFLLIDSPAPPFRAAPVAAAQRGNLALPRPSSIPFDPQKPESVTLVQPVQEYFLPFGMATTVGGHKLVFHRLGYYTHLGTDYGRMGPGESQITWQPGEVDVDVRQAGWAGMWHSLAGLAVDDGQTLDFLKCYPSWINDRFQPRCTGVTLRLRGTGNIKLEITGPEGDVLWQYHQDLHSREPQTLNLPCPSPRLRRAKFLNWVAEPGSQFAIDSLGLLIQFPPLSLAQRLVLVSYAKLARCYAPDRGVVKDHACRPAGAFDNVPASGLFCLATAAAWRLKIVDRAFAAQALHHVHQTVSGLPRARGLLPHFIHEEQGQYRIHPGTEYSTGDTSIYYHSMLLAAQMLGDEPVVADLDRAVHEITFGQLRDSHGFVIRGLHDDGQTPLLSSWREWGGETALVLLLERMAEKDQAGPQINRTGRVFRGVGFIAEIQSLFYPQFSRDRPDALTGRNWLAERRRLLDEQMHYFSNTWPSSAAARLGIYGLSAGEGFRGAGYRVNGTEGSGEKLIHPHYMLMSAALRPAPEAYQVLHALEASGLLPPWGMVENVTADLNEYLPWIGSLNASFETLGAYHLLARLTGQPDAVYEAAEACPPLRRAIQLFYPDG
jgi:hypothetical protein